MNVVCWIEQKDRVKEESDRENSPTSPRNYACFSIGHLPSAPNASILTESMNFSDDLFLPW